MRILSESEQYHLLGDNYEEMVNAACLKALRTHVSLSHIKYYIDGKYFKYYYEDYDVGEMSYFELKIIRIVDDIKGIVEVIEPNTFQAKPFNISAYKILNNKFEPLWKNN